mmetsp:Transcript_52231/g.86428  ORF Transcript_52231/g.86428 Transcript_52231/m.86428 type:complete len:152 (-) Transcript_52231:107-562(-)|eukprot:CAMPEP_0202694930 /NCGR_PEP_ID=MMETSP1385-20130828/8660_1 /ASSEMBLY_ACC=CAM_ASM_000861 /TAXON_ID=933848 /ORGANISM="Elphidium margaritaceum" /LENGTH=151 /DNA_ID=CAMNT_0049350869 /DNA_START=40 /DNA_END=495 /DNA_ORIENTATION=+
MSTSSNSENANELLQQIESLKKVINEKTVQLNMVIMHAEEKYHDIHENYRDMATELHNSWEFKYGKLQKENERLLHALTFIMKQNEIDHKQMVSMSNIPHIGETLAMENLSEDEETSPVAINGHSDAPKNVDTNAKPQERVAGLLVESYVD